MASSAAPQLSIKDQITQLETARRFVLEDAAHYPQIVQGILPIVGPSARIELRRWGAEFLAEMFSAPTLAVEYKRELALASLETLRSLVEERDTAILKSVVQCCASIYPLVFEHIVSKPTDPAWARMTAIKHKILQLWDTSSTGVRVCCIKFVQRVIQVQTPGAIADPRRPESNEISLSIVPRDHPTIPPPALEAESSGLLDRLLNVFQANPTDPILINATLNCIGVLIRTRQSISNKILMAILAFNPLKQLNSPMTPKIKVMVKSLISTTRSLLMNINKRNPGGPYAGRIQQHIDRLNQSRSEIFDEASRKRGPPEPTDGLDAAKRARLGAAISTPPPILPPVPPLPPGPVSLAQLFTISMDEAITSFDVTQLPENLVAKINFTVLSKLDQRLLDHALDGVRARYQSLMEPQPPVFTEPYPAQAPAEEDDDDDEYQPAEDAEQILNKLDSAPPEIDRKPDQEVALGTFKFAQPPPMTEQEIQLVGAGTVARVFRVMEGVDEPAGKTKKKSGFNRLAASNYDRDAWITVLSRLATRAVAGLEDGAVQDEVKSEDTAVPRSQPMLSDTLRQELYKYILNDFRRRIDIAVSWLNEEWYNDRVQSDLNEGYIPHYETWTLKVLDGILPYLDAKDKLFIKFMSEIPELSRDALDRVKQICLDPERVNLGTSTLQYLIILRPPTRELCLDVVEDLWRFYDDVKPATAKILAKWRPKVLEQSVNGAAVEEDGVAPQNGVANAAS